MATLYDYYTKKGKSLPSSVAGRFADPEFAAAAARAGYDQNSYAINKGNASANTSILNELSKGAVNPSPSAAPTAETPTSRGNPMDYIPESDETDRVLNSLLNQSKTDAEKRVDKEKIYKESLATFQAEIDSVNRIYDDILNSRLNAEKPNENNRLGRARATQASGGLLGSPRGDAQTSEVEQYNSEIRGGISSEVNLKRSAAISSLLGEARSYSTKEFERQTEAKRQGAESYLDYLSKQQERNQSKTSQFVKSLLSKGLKIEDLTEEEITQLAKEMGVSSGDIMNAYQSNDSVKATQKASRDGAITSLMKQGIKDPATILDYLNFDEQGNQIGDFSLDEVTTVTKALERKPVSVSQGSALYDPLTGERIAYNPKTSTGSGSGSGGNSGGNGGGSTTKIPSFEEFAASPEAKAFLDEEQQNTQQSFTPERSQAILQEVYNQEVAKLQKENKNSSPSLSNLTATNKRDLEAAGLSKATGSAQSYYLNAPTSFKSFYAQGVATGEFSQNPSVDELKMIQDEWESISGSTKKSGSRTP